MGPIPAGAGETVVIIQLEFPIGAYPRRRGGNDLFHQIEPQTWGLSPQARGKHETEASASLIPGPIPAGAGETAEKRLRKYGDRAYPRRRGGNPFCTWWPVSIWGLSPQARGKHETEASASLIPGPIPAGAGETP